MGRWVLLGIVIFCAGLFPILNKFGKGPEWYAFQLPVSLLAWVLTIGGFYLIIDSIIEITNSNIIGGVSAIVAIIITATGVLNVLGKG